MSEPTRWDAPAYHDASTVQREWGRALLDRHDWQGDETVLDAGCGSGGLVPDILQRAPRGSVLAVDADPGMVAEARKRLAHYGERVTLIQADLQTLPPVGPLDVVFSNAVLHWVPDHDAAFRGFHRVLRPGGTLIAQCGGKGNLKAARRHAERIAARPPYGEHFEGWRPGWHYEEVEPTRKRLEAAGFEHVQVALHAAPVTFPDDGTWRAFLQAVVARAYLQRLPPELGERLLDEYVAAAQGTPLARSLDYVRLTMEAKRAMERDPR